MLALLAAAAPAYAAGTGAVSYPGSAPLNGGSAATPTGAAGGAPPPRQAQDQAQPPPATAPAQAVLLANGKARPPATAPAAVKRAIRAGNRLQGKPYRFGGGHGRWEDDAYDCSGAISYVLRAAGTLTAPLDSGSLMRWGEPGRGTWISVYANPKHVYMVIAGLRLDTGVPGDRGPRWRTAPRDPRAFTVRHPAGL